MTGIIQSSCTSEQVAIWLRGLLTIAWIDGKFGTAERILIKKLVRKLAPKLNLKSLQSISPTELADSLGREPATAENFLRTAVMVAVADGIYSTAEDKLLQKFASALGQKVEALEVLRSTLDGGPKPVVFGRSTVSSPDVLKPVRRWLDKTEIQDPRVARFLCKMIPAQCPFERDIKLFEYKVVHIPPLCKLNPLYQQLVSLRFRALSYLADECGEDVSVYCQ